jgi:hypothetical protein
MTAYQRILDAQKAMKPGNKPIHLMLGGDAGKYKIASLLYVSAFGVALVGAVDMYLGINKEEGR